MKKAKLLASVLIAISALLAATLALIPFRRGLTQADFSRLVSGMTQRDVERLLGGPPRSDLRHRGTVFVPQPSGAPLSAFIAPGPVSQDFFPKVIPKGGRQAVWITKTGLIAVYYGQDGRLQSKYLSVVDEAVPPSVIDWLASRPGMIRRQLGL